MARSEVQSLDAVTPVMPARQLVSPEADAWPTPIATCAVPDSGIDLFVPEPDYHTISWAAAGSGVERLREPSWDGLRSHRDDLVIQQCGEEAWWRPGSVRQFRHVFLAPKLLSQLAQEVWDRDIGRELAVRPGFIQDQALRYMADVCFNRASDERNPMTAMEQDAWANVLGLEVLRRFTAGAPRSAEPVSPARERLSDSRLIKVKKRVEDGIADPLRLQDLAAEAGFSPFYFARAFKATTGLSPHQYVLERRVERAKHLLRHSSLSLAEIAMACGFSSQSHFSSQFRARVGVTPKAYRGGG